jgi:hypothetical protein
VKSGSFGNPNAPTITNYYVTPKSGDEDTLFTYYAIFNYSQAYPRNVQVKIDGTSKYNMTYYYSGGTNDHKLAYYYSTKLAPGKHNFTIVYNDYYTNLTKDYETNVTWEPYVWRNEITLNETSSKTAELNCSLNVYKALLNVTVEGDQIGTLNFTGMQMVIINKTSFDGKGFAVGSWSAKIETYSYTGSWQCLLYYKSAERRYYLKGTVAGDIIGVTEGYLTESTANSNIFDVYNTTWTICKIGKYDIYAKLYLNGTVDYQKTTKYDSSIYILQASFSGTAKGFYNLSLTVVLTHIRISNVTDPFYGQGFSVISYSTKNTTGQGWTYDRNSSTYITELHGYFTKPLLGLIFGKLNESGPKRTLYISIKIINIDSPPEAKLLITIFITITMV